MVEIKFDKYSEEGVKYEIAKAYNMIYSTLHNKNTNEDPKTSTIFEHLLLLPDKIIWEIIRDSSKTFKDKLPEDIGFLQSFEFWPHWNPNKTTNSNYVEPDVFFRFANLDLIVEAKYYEKKGQFDREWKNEIQAYKNVYLDENKDVYLLAIGGNDNIKEQELAGCKILKADWIDVLKCVKNAKEKYRKNFSAYGDSSLCRIFDLLIEGFHVMGVKDMEKTDLSALSKIHTLINMFDEVCGRVEEKDFSLSKYSASAATERYIYQFEVDIKGKPKKKIYLGLGMWYTYGGLIALEVGPEEGWAKPLVSLIQNKEEFVNKYLAKPYFDYGKYYFEPSDKFYKDFDKAESYDKQVSILREFVYGLIKEYIKKI